MSESVDQVTRLKAERDAYREYFYAAEDQIALNETVGVTPTVWMESKARWEKAYAACIELEEE